MSKRKRLRLKIDPLTGDEMRPGEAEGEKIPFQVPLRSHNLDEKVVDDFCKLLKRGLPADGVCDYLGINGGTFWIWVNKGSRYLDGNGTEPELAAYGYFVQRMRKAMAEYRLTLVDRLHTPDLEEAYLWKRDLAILERRDRKTFAREDMGSGEETISQDDRFL